jgi:NAD(P)-dependent dehydrogenase (short-subunit alcohol dehydrogenase family)
MSRKLEGKVAVVTGASAGIGLGIAKAFANEGARVFLTGRRQSELDKAVAEIGNGSVGIQGDAGKLADLDRVYATVREKAGRIDVLMLNAGFYEFMKVGEITEEHFDKTYGVNVKGLPGNVSFIEYFGATVKVASQHPAGAKSSHSFPTSSYFAEPFSVGDAVRLVRAPRGQYPLQS